MFSQHVHWPTSTFASKCGVHRIFLVLFVSSILFLSSLVFTHKQYRPHDVYVEKAGVEKVKFRLTFWGRPLIPLTIWRGQGKIENEFIFFFHSRVFGNLFFPGGFLKSTFSGDSLVDIGYNVPCFWRMPFKIYFSPGEGPFVFTINFVQSPRSLIIDPLLVNATTFLNNATIGEESVPDLCCKLLVQSSPC